MILFFLTFSTFTAGSFQTIAELHPPFANVDFHLSGYGFHRTLSVSFENLMSTCKILLKWDIPESYYVDPYQIHNLLQNNTARLTAHVNTEQMAHHAKTVFLYTLLDAHSSFHHVIPIHLRYHLPSNVSYLETIAKTPMMFASCSCESNCHLDENNETSHWSILGGLSVVNNKVIIPVGNLHHSSVVTVATLSICFISLLYVAWVGAR